MKNKKKFPRFCPRDPDLNHKKSPKNGKCVAVIGGGAAGMAADRELQIIGYAVEIFEKREKLGGQMRYSIPPWRAVDALLNKQTEFLKKIGAKINNNFLVNKDNFSNIKTKNDAVLITTGCSIPRKMEIKGEEYCLEGISFLEKFRYGEVATLKKELNQKKVLILGGGNTAIDVAVTAARFGAEAKLVYRRTKDEMPAFSHEIEVAEKEGVEFEFLLSPVEIYKKDDLLEVTFNKNKIEGRGEDGRNMFISTGEVAKASFHKVITAIGEKRDSSFIEEGEGIFLGGDLRYGPGDISRAVFDGRKAALDIDKFFFGDKSREVFPGEGICYDCGVCIVRCPTKAIDRKGKEKYEANLEKCISCGICEKTCPGNVWLMLD